MKRLALYCLLLASLALVAGTAGLEESSVRTSRFEPERKSRFRNGRTRTPKQKGSSTTLSGFGETQRPRFGQLYPSYNPFIVKPSQSAAVAAAGHNGLASAAGTAEHITSLAAGLGGGSGHQLLSTQLPPQSGTVTSSNPHRNSEFLKGKSKE